MLSFEYSHPILPPLFPAWFGCLDYVDRMGLLPRLGDEKDQQHVG